MHFQPYIIFVPDKSRSNLSRDGGVPLRPTERWYLKTAPDIDKPLVDQGEIGNIVKHSKFGLCLEQQ